MEPLLLSCGTVVRVTLADGRPLAKVPDAQFMSCIQVISVSASAPTRDPCQSRIWQHSDINVVRVQLLIPSPTQSGRDAHHVTLSSAEAILRAPFATAARAAPARGGLWQVLLQLSGLVHFALYGRMDHARRRGKKNWMLYVQACHVAEVRVLSESGWLSRARR
ncbi:unnamed protein product [Symbiodinium natans]|uniref:Uncharacterized protein n=1 Tax=Symbiodinium natans TaxID=878477 RepID=A0A812V5D1_9DINO|nr:unnamed protein product [Symbiodinium natans]